MSIMHPISKQKLGSYVALIEMKELPRGFRIVSTKALPNEQLYGIGQLVRDQLVAFQESKDVMCAAVFKVEDPRNAKTFLNPYCFGEYSNMAFIQFSASIAYPTRDSLIKKLNKES